MSSLYRPRGDPSAAWSWYIPLTLQQLTQFDRSLDLEDQALGRVHVLVASLCAAVVFIDGFDAQVMGFVAAPLSADLRIPRVALGAVISSGIFGMMLGALAFGPIADRVGRKPVLVACTLTFGLGSLLTATATTVAALTAFRIFTGFGMGGAMPNAIALTSEFMPARSRTSVVMTMFCGFSFGSACAGWVAAAVIRRFGWQSVFLVGGLTPLLLAVMLVAFLPESIRFLASKRAGEIAATGSSSVRQLIEGGRAGVTIVLWTIFFMNLLNLWFLNNWLPVIMSDAGIQIETAALITSLFQIGGLMGSLALAGVFGRRLSFRLLAGVFLAATVFILSIGEAGASIPLLAAAVFASGVAVIGGQTASNALAADLYPTAIRSTGVGWALGVGRVGSILGPILGGVLLSYGGDTRRVFWAAAVPALVATIAAFTIGGAGKAGGAGHTG
jgi:AAHS family 4-hydroxybenzoate transporter-like MFS transporter